MNSKKRLSLIILSCLLAGFTIFCSVLVSRNDSSRKVYIQPLGSRIPAADLEIVRNGIQQLYGFTTIVMPRKRLPRFAYYPPRRRYRAEKLLDFLHTVKPTNAKFIIGLTAVDISTTKGRYPDWGIMGLATLDGSVCVISSFRCRLGSHSILHARQRLAKVAVHELGHNLGLPHCPTRGCLMEDAKGTNKTCDREYDLCGNGDTGFRKIHGCPGQNHNHQKSKLLFDDSGNRGTPGMAPIPDMSSISGKSTTLI